MLRTDPAVATIGPAGDLLQGALNAALYPSYPNLFHWLSCILSLGIDLSLVLMLTTGHVYGWEKDVTREIQALPGMTPIGDVTSGLTNASSLPFVLLVLATAGFVSARGERSAAALLLCTIPLHLLAQVPRAVVSRPLPSPDFPGITGFHSFPSGQAELVITFYGFLTYLLLRRFAREWQRNVILWTFVAFAFLTGLGRIAEGRNWPLDVLASYVVGLGILSGLIWVHAALCSAREDGADVADPTTTVPC